MKYISKVKSKRWFMKAEEAKPKNKGRLFLNLQNQQIYETTCHPPYTFLNFGQNGI